MEPLLFDILIPTQGRKQLLVRLVDSIRRTTPVRSYFVTFVVDENDKETIETIATHLAGLDVQTMLHDGTFPQKVNYAFARTHAPMAVVCGNDVIFHEGWSERALRHRGVGVIGTNDRTPRTRDGGHATAQIVDRRYIEELGGAYDEPGHVFHEGYYHNYADNELCVLARYRDEWTFERACVIEHRHPCWGTAPTDEVYERANRYFQRDKKLWRYRRRLWMRRRQ